MVFRDDMAVSGSVAAAAERGGRRHVEWSWRGRGREVGGEFGINSPISQKILSQLRFPSFAILRNFSQLFFILLYSSQFFAILRRLFKGYFFLDRK